MEDMLAANESESSNVHNQASGSLPVDKCDSVLPDNDSKLGALSAPSKISQFYETKVTALTRKNAILDGQLAAALAGREAAEKNLSSALKSKQDMEKKLADMMKGMEMLKEKLAGVELAQEEANSLSNIVHSDNVRLEHDVAFLKAVLDDTQKVGIRSIYKLTCYHAYVDLPVINKSWSILLGTALNKRSPCWRTS